MSKELRKFEDLKTQIYTIRGMKVMLDRDLAFLYTVKTEALNQAVKRNSSRFPADFMFQLTKEEFQNWTSQFVMSNSDKMGLRRPPYAFTELGVAMLSSVLNSNIAIEVNIRIMRAFVELRKTITINPEYEQLNEKIRRIESQMETMSTNTLVENILIEKKLTTMSADIRRISEALDNLQDSYIVIKRPEEGLNKG